MTSLAVAPLAACGAAGGSSSAPPPPPPPAITVSVSPTSASLYFGQQQQFLATVTGTTSTGVNWQVNAVTGGDASHGTVTAQGLYTAPDSLPSPPTVTVTAVSQADASASSSATVTLESDIRVAIAPASASLNAGGSETFTAQVTGTGSPNPNVNWSLTGPTCPANCGTLSTNGNSATYTAPATVSSSFQVQTVATSIADPTRSASSTIAVAGACSPAISVSPSSASLATGAQQAFTAELCTGGNVNVTWSVTGGGCSGANCGTVSSTGANTGLYTAPASLPPSNPVTLVATNSADASETASASITITSSCGPAISISPSASTVPLGQAESLTAQVCFSANQSVTWKITGGGCSGTNCGSVSSTGANTATYTAPASLPPSNPVTVVATSVADSTEAATASITVTSGVLVSVDITASALALDHRMPLAASVTGTANQQVSWAVDGVANGNAALGQICVSGSSPCAAPSGPVAGGVDFLAPAAVPVPAGVYATATAAADPSQSATAAITILAHLSIQISPAAAVIAPSGTVEFAATVSGTSSTGVTWQATCSAGDCGTITAAGVFTGPATAPGPNSITVTVTSQDDPTQSAEAAVALTSAVAVRALLPSSATAGLANGFTLAVAGYDFVSTSPGPGTTLLVNGAAHATTCSSSTACTTTISPADATAPGTLDIEAKNPDGTLSDSLPFVLAPAGGSVSVVSLTAAAPIATAEDITAVEPTTAGSGADSMTIVFLGTMDASGNTCNVSLAPLEFTLPASGTAAYTLCVAGTGLDPTYTYALAGSGSAGVSLSNAQSFSGSLVALTLTIAATAMPGPRTLLVTDPNDNRAAASGAIDLE